MGGLTLLVFLFSQLAVAQEARKTVDAPERKAQPDIEALRNKSIREQMTEWRAVKAVLVRVSLQGSAEGIGLQKALLEDFALLRLKNNVSAIRAFSGSRFDDAISRRATTDPEVTQLFAHLKAKALGFLSFTVWTVGDQYPVAFHLKIELRGLSPPLIEPLLEEGIAARLNGAAYENAILGFTSKSNAEERIRKSIDELIEAFAIQFYKNRKEM